MARGTRKEGVLEQRSCSRRLGESKALVTAPVWRLPVKRRHGPRWRGVCVGVALGALVFANLVAALPGRIAARTPTALVLRTE
jgi:hypothetical protein